MATKEELREMLSKEHMFGVLNKHHKIDELYALLDIMRDRGYFHDVDYVLRNFPKTKEYDSLKINILNEIISKVSPFVASEIIVLIVDDYAKLETLEKYRHLFDNFEISNVISSIRSDNVRKEMFRKNIDNFNDEEFSDYLRNIKSDKLRMEEFLLFKDKYPNYNLAWFAASFEGEEKKIEIFNQYFDESKREYISHFTDYIKDEDKKIMLLDKYIDYLDEYNIKYTIGNITNLDRIIYVLRKYKDKMNHETITDLIGHVEDEDKRIELLVEFSDLMSPYDIMETLIKIKNVDKRIELFDKYKDLFAYRELHSMLVYMDDAHGRQFLDRFVDIFPSGLLASMWTDPYFYHHIHITGDELLNKYIDRIDASGFAAMMEKGEKEKLSVVDFIEYLKTKTNNKKTIRRIINGAVFYNIDCYLLYYLSEFDFTQEERSICNELSGGNVNFYSYFLFELFDIPALKNNRYFLSKLSKYPDISQKIVDLYHKNPNIINLLLLLIKKLYDYDIYYDGIINNLIAAFSSRSNTYLNNIVIGELNEERKITLIYKLINYRKNKSVNDIDVENNNDLDTYLVNRNTKIDNLYLECNKINDKKNLLFNKIFGISLELANRLLEEYGVSLDKYDNNSELKYIRLIKTIIEEENIENIDKYYYNLPIIDLEERILLEQNLRKIFNKNVIDSLYKIDNNKPDRYLSYNGHNIPVYRPTGEFHLLVNSLSAYASHDSIEDYNKFWNNNSNVKNHGICTSLISNQNICQTAPVYDVIVGFDDFADTAIQLADSTDLGSSNDEFELWAGHTSRFMNAEDYIDETRHNHNELVVERRELRKNKSNINLKPSYVVIYDYYDEERVNRSLRAASELNIPVVYLDTKEIVLRENNIIKSYFEDAKSNLNLDSFKKFLVRYSNNFHGLIDRQKDLANIYFSEERLKTSIEIIFLRIDLLFSNKTIDKEEAINLYKGVLKELEKENDKCSKESNKKLDLSSIIDTGKEKLNAIIEKEELKVK